MARAHYNLEYIKLNHPWTLGAYPSGTKIIKQKDAKYGGGFWTTVPTNVKAWSTDFSPGYDTRKVDSLKEYANIHDGSTTVQAHNLGMQSPAIFVPSPTEFDMLKQHIQDNRRLPGMTKVDDQPLYQTNAIIKEIKEMKKHETDPVKLGELDEIHRTILIGQSNRKANLLARKDAETQRLLQIRQKAQEAKEAKEARDLMKYNKLKDAREAAAAAKAAKATAAAAAAAAAAASKAASGSGYNTRGRGRGRGRG